MIERWIPSFINEMGLGNESHSRFSSTKAVRLASFPDSLVLAPLDFEDVRHDETGFCTLGEWGHAVIPSSNVLRLITGTPFQQKSSCASVHSQIVIKGIIS